MHTRQLAAAAAEIDVHTEPVCIRIQVLTSSGTLASYTHRHTSIHAQRLKRQVWKYTNAH